MNDLQVIKHKNERVLLTSQLAEVYETDVKNIQMNFKRNENRFIEGRDYYLLKGDELKEFKNLPTVSGLVDPRTPSLHLWTERGANRHSKILDTDQAWKQFDVLEETYFKVKDTGYKIPSTPMEVLGLMFEVQKQTDKRLEHLENNMTIDTTQQYHLEKMAKNKVIKLLGGKNSSAYLKYSKKVFAQLWRDYKDYFKIPSYRDTLKAKYHEAEEYLNTWYPSNNLKMEIEEANRFDY